MDNQSFENQSADTEPREGEKPFVNLEGFGIREDVDISAEKIAEILEKCPGVIEGIKRNFYWSIRHALSGDFDQRRSMHPKLGGFHMTDHTNLTVRPFNLLGRKYPPWVDRPKDWIPERAEVLGDNHEERYLAEVIFAVGDKEIPSGGSHRSRPIEVRLVFSTDEKTVRDYWDGLSQFFTSVDDFTFHGAYLQPQRGERRVALQNLDEKQIGEPNAVRYSLEKLQHFLDASEPMPEVRCDEAVAVLRELGEAEGLAKEEIEGVAQAIRTFATFQKPEPTTGEQCFTEIGQCLSIPPIFADFCAEREGLPVTEDFYEISSASLDFRTPPSFYHGVNLYREKLAIDWTARQFGKFEKEPYPFIYRVGDARIPERWGPLRRLERKKEGSSS